MQLSAFVDGELPENEAELLLRRLSQDAELRQQVAEFMAIGRAMRGEVQVTGIDSLRDRVAEALDSAPAMEEAADELPAENRFVKPMAGFAIAATVALVAIFGLRQISIVDGVDNEGPQLAGEQGPGYTQQQPGDISEDELLREMRRSHDAATADQSINTRLTTVEVPPEAEELDDEEAVDENDEGDDATTDTAPVE